MEEAEENKRIKRIVEQALKTNILRIDRVTGGLVHYVYKIELSDKIIFAKIRKDHLSEIKNISTKPELIKDEFKALTIFGKIAPEIFPQVINYFSDEHMLLLSDVMPHRKTLEIEADRLRIKPKQACLLGEVLADIHKKLKRNNEPIREDSDIAYYTQLHYYRFGYHKHPILDDLVKELEKLPKQLVIGDLSPKNIGISSESKITICDLENVHYGNTISDTGFLASSIILHTINNQKLAYGLLTNFLKGYSSKNKIDSRDIILKRIVLGVALYRLSNPVIPYKVAINSKQREKIVKKIKEILYKEKLSWKEITNSITV